VPLQLCCKKYSIIVYGTLKSLSTSEMPDAAGDHNELLFSGSNLIVVVFFFALVEFHSLTNLNLKLHYFQKEEEEEERHL